MEPLSITHHAEHLAYWREAMGGDTQFVYIIEANPSTAIKVGVSVSPEKRLRQHQTSNHEELRLLMVFPGDHGDEAVLHSRLAGAHLRGEWFSGAAIPGFLRWVARRIYDMRWMYEAHGVEPCIDVTNEPRGGKGIPSGAYFGHGLQSRWRCSDGKRSEVRVSFVDPESLKSDTPPPPRPTPQPYRDHGLLKEVERRDRLAGRMDELAA